MGEFPGRPAYNPLKLVMQLLSDGPELKIKQRTCGLHKWHKLRLKGLHQVQLGPPAVPNKKYRTRPDLWDNMQPTPNKSKQ